MAVDYKVEGQKDPVTPPTNEDIYEKAAEKVTEWPEIANDDSEVMAENELKHDQ